MCAAKCLANVAGIKGKRQFRLSQATHNIYPIHGGRRITSMVIRHNLGAMNARRQYSIVNSTKSKHMEKLSSGYKINRAADDAAGQILAAVKTIQAAISQ